MLATYGSGLSSACVVDVGDQKTSVCCVEDGLSHRNTRYVLKFQDVCCLVAISLAVAYCCTNSKFRSVFICCRIWGL